MSSLVHNNSAILPIHHSHLPGNLTSFRHPPNLNTHRRPPSTSLNSSSPSSSSSSSSPTQHELPSNAFRRKRDPQWRGGFSLGVDLGMARTGVAISKGFSIRPITVLELRGQKLEFRLMDIAEEEEADEFIIGLPKSSDGKETPQSNVVRSVAGRFAVRAAERGWRVYLQNEHGTSAEALDLMLDMGIKKSSRQGKLDAYAAMMVLERYFSMSGDGAELILPKDLGLQEKLQQGPPKDLDFFPEQNHAETKQSLYYTWIIKPLHAECHQVGKSQVRNSYHQFSSTICLH